MNAISISHRPSPVLGHDTARVVEFKSSRTWKQYGKALRAAREARGLSLRELSQKIKVPAPTLHRLELGTPVLRRALTKVERWLARLDARLDRRKAA